MSFGEKLIASGCIVGYHSIVFGIEYSLPLTFISCVCLIAALSFIQKVKNGI